VSRPAPASCTRPRTPQSRQEPHQHHKSKGPTQVAPFATRPAPQFPFVLRQSYNGTIAPPLSPSPRCCWLDAASGLVMRIGAGPVAISAGLAHLGWQNRRTSCGERRLMSVGLAQLAWVLTLGNGRPCPRGGPSRRSRHAATSASCTAAISRACRRGPPSPATSACPSPHRSRSTSGVPDSRSGWPTASVRPSSGDAPSRHPVARHSSPLSSTPSGSSAMECVAIAPIAAPHLPQPACPAASRSGSAHPAHRCRSSTSCRGHAVRCKASKCVSRASYCVSHKRHSG